WSTTPHHTGGETETGLVRVRGVQAALDRAWAASQPDDPAARHEEGGWIYMDAKTGQITIQRAARGILGEIDLSKPPPVVGAVVVGKFHTHPNPAAEGWLTGPSG